MRLYRLATLTFLSALTVLAASATARAQSAPCVQIYYDYTLDPVQNPWGRVYAMTLQNLLAHFPKYQQIVEPIENYRKGDLNRCRASFYIGSFYDNYVPQEFIDDYQTTFSNVMWIGYNIWKIGQDKLPQVLGWTHAGLSKLNTQKLDKDKKPTFYRDVLYKGEKFRKFGEFAADGSRNPDGSRVFYAPFEQAILRRPAVKDPRNPGKEIPVPNPPGVMLAEVQHNGTGDKIPYIVRNANKFYVADVPFAYMHEADRYLVFADTLFDVLGETPRFAAKKPAVLRFEDVSSCEMNEELRLIKKVMLDKNVPFHLALIPIYANPQGRVGECEDQKWSPMTEHPEFQAVVQELRQAGGTVIMHGVTHQYTDPDDPTNVGVSGDDFEFWDHKHNHPVVGDSVSWVLQRLEWGYSELERSGIRPQIWEFPHYEGSPLDYMIVSRVFSWHIGRFAYVPYTVTGAPAEDHSLWYETTGTRGATARLAALSSLAVEFDRNPSHRYNMFYPYEAYGDVYGERVLPENLNYVTKWGRGHDQGQSMIDDMIDNLKRNRVLRDTWASLFIHPYLLEKGDTGPLKKIIDRVRENGYEFINLEQFISDKKTLMRPPTIERALGDQAPIARR